jgi:serine/threonine protein kinase
VLSSAIPAAYDPDAIADLLVNPAHVDDVYELGEEIGAGAFGWVIRATHRETGEVCAMKAQSIRDNRWCFRELEMASRVDHPFCAKALDAFVHKDKLLIVTPMYTGSDLYDYIIDDSRVAFSEHDAFALCQQMLSALEACHRAGFAHLDVKPENFMFKEKRNGSDLVLVDYGSAEPFEKAAYAETQDEYVPERDDVLTTLSRITGTACYMSPEVARGNFSSRSDVWSAAVCLYILMALEPPFEMTLKPRLSTDPAHQAHIEEPRFQAAANLDHPAIVGMSDNGRELLCSMMHSDPALRLSATEALRGIETHLGYLESMGIGPVNRVRGPEVE